MARATNAIGQTPDRRADPQSGRLSPQRHPNHHAERGLREDSHAHIVIAFAAGSLVDPVAAAEEKPIAAEEGAGPRQGREQLRRLPQPRLHPDELAVSRRGGWDAEVTKMIKAFGAPIDDADAKVIADYLKKNYGS